jgi:hypothetical protein
VDKRSVIMAAMMAAGTMLVSGPSVARAEEGTVQALSSWQARMRVYVTGPQQAFMTGAFGGRLFVEKESGALDAAQLWCPGAVEADYEKKAQRGEGRCIITARTGDRVFARWTCSGPPDTGCAGKFTLTGGTGKFQGITGEGDFALRLVVSEALRMDRQELEYDLTGLAVWPALRYRIP